MRDCVLVCPKEGGAMRVHSFRALLVCFLVVGLIGAVAHARRTGTNAGYTGGPFGATANCTECHEFGEGSGRIEVFGAPPRYRLNVVYDLSVRVSDPDQFGGGFSVSAERSFGHGGTLQITDPVNTQFSENGSDPFYVTHTEVGVGASVANWESMGGATEYEARWRAPSTSRGVITLYVAGLAINNDNQLPGDHFYATYSRMWPAVPSDADGDGDVDLSDVAHLMNCMGVLFESPLDDCGYVDSDADGVIEIVDGASLSDRLTGPTAPAPAAYALADVVRGGKLYDRFWRVIGAPTPTGKHPLYPPIGLQSGSGTYRCKECHGWDYKGADGVYGSGSRFTGIKGVFGSAMKPQEIFDLLKADPAEISHGHNYAAYGMSDADLWDVTRFVLEGIVNTDALIDESGDFVGTIELGEANFVTSCVSCHGTDGTALNFGSEASPEYIGSLALENPWEFLHKARFGDPGTAMLGGHLVGWSASVAADVGVYAQTLPAP